MNNIKGHLIKFRRWSLACLQAALATWHGYMILLGLTAGLIYLVAWAPRVVTRAAQGSAGFPLVVGCLAIGFHQLWKHRQRIAQLKASEADRAMGYLMIGGAVVLFPFCRFAIWPQAMLWVVILAGIAISSWGPRFFVHYRLPVMMALLTAYPQPAVFGRTVWAVLTPSGWLERAMAQAGAFGLRLMGQPAVAQAHFVILPPRGSVAVGEPCNGFSMALTIAATGLIMGILYQQKWHRIVLMMAMGIGLAFLFNVPRIMLLAYASVYWGKAVFDFWHNTWGAQIFSAVLFTVYYYGVMALIKKRPLARATANPVALSAAVKHPD
ncbi:MAG: cyanoexosortase C [Cyanobacteria bacterium REEB459]|nr:cyanoexosortase C [Cyanobacteria bacterium REEB459]